MTSDTAPKDLHPNEGYPKTFGLPEDPSENITGDAAYMYAAHRYRTRTDGIPHREMFNHEYDFKGHPAIEGPQFRSMRAFHQEQTKTNWERNALATMNHGRVDPHGREYKNASQPELPFD